MITAEDILTCKEVMAYTKIARSTLYYLIRRNRFPAPFKIGVRAARWKGCDIIAWVEGLEKNEP